MIIGGLIIGGPLIWEWYKQRKNRVLLQDGLTEQDGRNEEQNRKLEEAFESALNTLNKSQKRRSFWTTPRELYELPWYIIIGPPGSGKTTALRKSGLNFPLQQSSEINAIKGIGGTRNCDWWFTDEAVLIDTAGRFSTQDSHQATDSQGWKKFLQLLKKTRPKQPINGVLLTLSVEDLLTSPAKLDDLAGKLRRRLQELTDEFSIQLPIYLLITKLDLIPGFTETFALYSPDEIKQGLGFTLNDQASSTQSERLKKINDEFLVLESNLQKQIHKRLQNEPSVDRRRVIFEFINQLGQLALPLQTCLKKIFDGEGRFFAANRLRGFYLTSGTQQGTALARLNAEINPLAQRGYSSAHSRAYFIEKVMQEVIFRERDLVGLVKHRVMLDKLTKMGLGVASVAVTAILVVGWWISHNNNLSTLDQVAQNAASAEQTLEQPPVDNGSIDLITLGQLNALAGLAPIELQQVSWQNGLGLNQNEKVLFAQQRSYQKALDSLLIPRINQRLEFQLSEFSGNDLEVTYEVLKVYLMMHQAKHRDVNEIKEWVLHDWKLNQLSHLDAQGKQDALKHLELALTQTSWQALPPAQNELIEMARQSLSLVSTEERLFSKLKRLHDIRYPKPFDMLDRAGADLSGVLTRESNQSLSIGPNAFYTKRAYAEFFYPELTRQLEDLNTEGTWVMGAGSTGQQFSITKIQKAIRQQYAREYIEAWRAYISDIRIKQASSLEQALQVSRQLAKERSPLERFMREVANQTQLGAVLDATTKAASKKVERVLESKTGGELAFLGQTQNTTDVSSINPETQVDDYFRPIINLFENDGTGYLEVSSLLNQLYNLLSALEIAKKEQSIPPSASEFNALASQAGLLPEPVKSSIQQLSNHAGQHTQKAQRENLTSELRPLRDVCSASIAGRYPFKADAKLEVLPQDFTRLFGPNGQMAQHFDTHLAPLVNKGAGNWKFRAGGDASGQNSNALIQFQRAHEIQQVFFDGKPNPGFSFTMTLIDSNTPGDTFYMQYSGKLNMFSQEFDPSHSLQWPPTGTNKRLEIRSSEDTKPIVFDGYWGLFRLFDKNQTRTGNGPEEFISRITLGEQWFDFRVTATSALNPLRLNALKRFSCPGGL